jgi:MFS transporter, Spinster family, sphingosine-1-phosphate transporter
LNERKPSAPVEPVSAAAWRLLIFLTLLDVLNFVDRWLVASVAPLLIQELGLSRAQIGLLTGFGFVFFYTFVGLFLGLAADRWRRIPLVALGLAMWSGMTALSGLARSFVQLAIPRIFVGVGEATLTPAALSMLGDVFPARRLAMASGVYYAGIPLGTAVSLLASSYLAPRYGWRACFLILGVVGLVAVGILLMFREPARRAGHAQAIETSRPHLKQLVHDITRLLVERRDLLLILLGGSLLCFGAGAALHNVTWLVEERGFSYARAAFLSGIVAVFAGFFGNLAGGTFGDWYARRRPNGHLWSLVPMTAFFVPISLVFYALKPGTPIFYVCWFFASAGTSAWFGPLFAAIQEASPSHTRATAVAFALLVMNLLGVGPGPLVTGMIGDARGLTTALVVSLGVVALAIVPFALAARRKGDEPIAG